MSHLVCSKERLDILGRYIISRWLTKHCLSFCFERVPTLIEIFSSLSLKYVMIFKSHVETTISTWAKTFTKSIRMHSGNEERKFPYTKCEGKIKQHKSNELTKWDGAMKIERQRSTLNEHEIHTAWNVKCGKTGCCGCSLHTLNHYVYGLVWFGFYIIHVYTWNTNSRIYFVVYHRNVSFRSISVYLWSTDKEERENSLRWKLVCFYFYFICISWHCRCCRWCPRCCHSATFF